MLVVARPLIRIASWILKMWSHAASRIQGLNILGALVLALGYGHHCSFFLQGFLVCILNHLFISCRCPRHRESGKSQAESLSPGIWNLTLEHQKENASDLLKLAGEKTNLVVLHNCC